MYHGVTGPAIELFYGVTLLAAAWRGQPDCEVTVISNLALGRDDQVGCPLFSLIDHFERRRRGRAVRAQPASPADTAVETSDWTWPG